MRVQVYRNLHKDCWSVKCKKTKKVIMHKETVLLENCKFVVQQGGRDRVLREKRKNVHAFVEGDLVNTVSMTTFLEGIFIKYNPYKNSQFTTGERDVLTAKSVIMNSDFRIIGEL